MTKPTITAYQIKDLRCDVDGLKTDVAKILQNHLPHINEAVTKLEGKVDNLKTRINVLSVVNVSAIILGILIAKYL